MTLATLDRDSSTLAGPAEVELGTAQDITIAMEAQSVALLRLSCP